MFSLFAVEKSKTVFSFFENKPPFTLKVNGMITAKQVVDNTRISTQQGASTALNRLIARGLIIKQGIGHHTHYVLVKDY